MVSVTEAADIIFSNLHNPVLANVNLREAVNNVLAESIKADRDFPPFDRVSMDGIAVQFEKWKGGQREFPIEFTKAAGDSQRRMENPGSCVEVMTGAALPENTDTVIRYEDLEIKDRVASVLIDATEQG